MALVTKTDQPICCSQARLALAMDGLQLGERKVRVSMAKPSSLEKYYEKIGQKDSRPPAAIALQVSCSLLPIKAHASNGPASAPSF